MAGQGGAEADRPTADGEANAKAARSSDAATGEKRPGAKEETAADNLPPRDAAEALNAAGLAPTGQPAMAAPVAAGGFFASATSEAALAAGDAGVAGVKATDGLPATPQGGPVAKEAAPLFGEAASPQPANSTFLGAGAPVEGASAPAPAGETDAPSPAAGSEPGAGEGEEGGASAKTPPGLAVAQEQAAAPSVAAAGLEPPLLRADAVDGANSAIEPPGLAKRADQGATTDGKGVRARSEQAPEPAAEGAALSPAQQGGTEQTRVEAQPREIQTRPDGGLLPSAPQARAPDAAAPPPAPALPPELPRAVPPAAVPVEIGLRALQGVREFQIRLDPAELGRVEVRLEIGEDKSVTARVVVDRVETLQLLQRDARTLERAFEQAGLKTTEGGVDITLRDPGQQARDGRGDQEDMRHGQRGRGGREGGEPEAAPVQPLFRRAVHRGALDLSI